VKNYLLITMETGMIPNRSGLIGIFRFCDFVIA
jgi:hypothetical protein